MMVNILAGIIYLSYPNPLSNLLMFFKNYFKKKKDLRITAIMTVRNEEVYLDKCLEYLVGQGISVIIVDNESTDGSINIIKKHIAKGSPVTVLSYPFSGIYNWEELLQNMAKVASGTDSDWFIMTAPDEILQAPARFESLAEGIAYVDRKGYNVINFDEIVFLPTSMDESFVGKDYELEMKYYYFHEPRPKRLLRAWKSNGKPVDLSSHGSHRVVFENQKVYPHNFYLKHYIFLSHEYGIKKYGSRIFPKKAIDKGWHNNRYYLSSSSIILPDKGSLLKISKPGKFDTSDPKKEHLFIRSRADKQDSDFQVNLKGLHHLPKADPEQWKDALPVIFFFTFDDISLDLVHPFLEKMTGAHFITHSETLKQYILERIPRKVDAPVEASLDQGLMETYLRKVKDRGKIVIDCSRTNYTIAPVIPHFIPAAKFIHLVQDIQSIVQLEDPLHLDILSEKCIKWYEFIKNIRQSFQYCEHTLEIKLEDLALQPGNTSQILLDFIGMESTDARSFSDGLKSKINPRDLGLEETETIDRLTGNWRTELGYKSKEGQVYES